MNYPAKYKTASCMRQQITLCSVSHILRSFESEIAVPLHFESAPTPADTHPPPLSSAPVSHRTHHRSQAANNNLAFAIAQSHPTHRVPPPRHPAFPQPPPD